MSARAGWCNNKFESALAKREGDLAFAKRTAGVGGSHRRRLRCCSVSVDRPWHGALTHHGIAAASHLVRGVTRVLLRVVFPGNRSCLFPLLHDVREFMREQSLALRGFGREPPSGEKDVLSDGECARLFRIGHFCGVAIGVNPHLAESLAEARLHQLASALVQPAAALQLADDAGWVRVRLMSRGVFTARNRIGCAIGLVFLRIRRLADARFALQPSRAQQ
jgi:hypothetical protein